MHIHDKFSVEEETQTLRMNDGKGNGENDVNISETHLPRTRSIVSFERERERAMEQNDVDGSSNDDGVEQIQFMRRRRHCHDDNDESMKTVDIFFRFFLHFILVNATVATLSLPPFHSSSFDTLFTSFASLFFLRCVSPALRR